jgi:hypothetical protein
LPVDWPQSAAHSASIGATSVDPAPLSVAAEAAAVLRPKTQPANSAAQVNLANSFERNAVFLSSWEFPFPLSVARPPLASVAKHPHADLSNCGQFVTMLLKTC